MTCGRLSSRSPVDSALMRISLLCSVAIVLSVPRVSLGADEVTPLPRAHAHNDYLHPRPLLDALQHGFCSVEADVFLVDGRLLVAHTKSELSRDRTFEGLYLKPLQDRIRANDGRVYKDGPVFRLLIDIKSSGRATWSELNRVLAEYADLFSRVEDGEFHESAVTAVISGNRPFTTVEETSPRYAGIDGRVSNFGDDFPAHLMPLISDNWNRHFRWRGEGEFPEAERQKLQQMVDTAHKEGRLIRFWASPDTPEAWEVLHTSGADLINTDNLSGLSTWLRAQSQ